MALILLWMRQKIGRLFIALEASHKYAVSIFVSAVLADKTLTPEDKKEILLAKDQEGTPGLFMALQNGHEGAVSIFVSAVLADKTLTPEDKKEILLAKDQDGTPGLFMALQNGHEGAVSIFVSAVLADKTLTPEDKKEILIAKDRDGTSGLYLALYNGYNGIVSVFISAVLADKTLTPEDKKEILLAKRKDGTSGLFIALQNDRQDAVSIFVSAVLADTKLTPKMKYQLGSTKQISLNIIGSILEVKKDDSNDARVILGNIIKNYILEAKSRPNSDLDQSIKIQIDFLLYDTSTSANVIDTSACLVLLMCDVFANQTAKEGDFVKVIKDIKKTAKENSLSISTTFFSPKIVSVNNIKYLSYGEYKIESVSNSVL